MKTYSTTIIGHLQATGGGAAPIVLARISTNRTTASEPVAYLTNDTAELVYAGETYRPFPMALGPLNQKKVGGSGQSAWGIQISNRRRDLAPYLEAGAGAIGNRVTITEGLRDFAGFYAMTTYTVRVNGVELDDQWLKLSLANRDLNAAQFPSGTYRRTFCDLAFGGVKCAFAITQDVPAPLQDCSHLLSGATGCEAHGAFEASVGRPVLHPRNWGGWAGVGGRVR